MEMTPKKKDPLAAISPMYLAVIFCVGVAVVLVCGIVYGWSDKGFWGSLKIGAIAGAVLATILKVRMIVTFRRNVEREMEIALGQRKRGKAWYHILWSFIHPLAFGSVTEYLHKMHLPLIPAIGMLMVMMIAVYPEQKRLYDTVRDRLAGTTAIQPRW